MNTPAQRLTARDLIAKSFTAKSRRGYDPAEVDAYLMDVARQVDELNLEIDRLTNEVVRLSFTQAPVIEEAPAPVEVMAPPPPPPAPAPAPVPVAAPAPAPVVEIRSASEAEEESLRMILRAAQRTAEQTLAEAKQRAEEIVNEAKFRAAEITRDSDRKAFEAASRGQEELAKIEDEVKRKRYELDSVRRAIEAEKENVRDLAKSLLDAVGDKTTVAAPAQGAVAAGARGAIGGSPVPNGNVVDLTQAPAEARAES
jgi:DivIVA domain-containing protein